jgi:hypothetical protein
MCCKITSVLTSGTVVTFTDELQHAFFLTETEYCFRVPMDQPLQILIHSITKEWGCIEYDAVASILRKSGMLPARGSVHCFWT